MTLSERAHAVRNFLRDEDERAEGLIQILSDVVKASVPFSDADYIEKHWDGKQVTVLYRREIEKLRATLSALLIYGKDRQREPD